VSAPSITARERRILIAAASKLTTSSQPGEREGVFQRINGELDRLKITWADIFEKALPHPEEVAARKSGSPDLMAAADAMMGGFADMMAGRTAPPPRPGPVRRRHLAGDEIPLTISGRIAVIDEREWRGGTMMFVNVTSDEFVYGPMVIFQDVSQETARNAGDRTVTGRVDQPGSTAQSPVLHGLTLD
jgi:hypothetical protein